MLGRQTRPGAYRSLEGVSVLVTRPSTYAEYLIGEIETRGGHAIALPTVQVEFMVEDSGLPTLLCENTRRKIVIFTSRNAVDAVAEWLRISKATWPPILECVAVGRKTAQAIQSAFGVDDVLYPEAKHGIDGLMETDRMLNLNQLPSVIIDGGGANSEKLAEVLQQRGSSSILHFVVYRRKCPDVDIKHVSDHLGQGSIDYVVITSVSGASNLFELLGKQLTARLMASCLIAYSQRVADYLWSKGFERVVVASESCDDAVIDAIEKSVQPRKVTIAGNH